MEHSPETHSTTFLSLIILSNIHIDTYNRFEEFGWSRVIDKWLMGWSKMGVGTVTHHEPHNYSGTSEAPIIWYLISHEVGETIFAPGESRLGQYRWEIG